MTDLKIEILSKRWSSRRRYSRDDFQGPESCSDVDKHPNEKKLLLKASTDRSKENEIQTMEKNIAHKMSVISETKSSF